MSLYDVNPDVPREIQDRISSELGIGAPTTVRAKFLLTAPLNPTLSAQHNRPIHTDVISIIEIPDGVKDYISRPASEKDKAKYPLQWAGFQSALADPQFSIDHLAGAKPSEIAMFKANKITTIQQAAAMTNPQPELADAVLRAKRWMAIANGEKPRIKLEAVA